MDERGYADRAEDERYRRLPAGMHGLDADDVARDQRSRLQMAMVELVASRGYNAVRITDLTRLAGVSRPTFYSLFENKEECFLTAYDKIARSTSKTIVKAYEAAAERERPGAALGAFLQIAAERPTEISLLVLGSLGAGEAARARRERTIVSLSRNIRRIRGASGGRDLGEEMLMNVVLGGLREVTANRLRSGRATELPRLADDLTEWAISYRAKPPSSLEPPRTAAERRKALSSIAPASQRERQSRLPSGRHDLSPRFVALNQRERIVDAVAELAAKRGYENLSIPAIAGLAGVSHQTFYEHFEGKQDAFLSAMRVGVGTSVRRCEQAYAANRQPWPIAFGLAMHAFLHGIAAEPDYASVGFVEVLAAGPDALDLRDESTRAFATFVEGGFSSASAAGRRVPPIATEAISGGIWQVVHLEVAAGRARELPLLAPMLIYVALAPFVGSREATRYARRKPPRRR